MSDLFIITNDRYSPEPDEITYEGLVAMCNELWGEGSQEPGPVADFADDLYIDGDVIRDGRGDVVAVRKDA